MSTYRFSAPLWQYPGEGSWYFVSVPEEISNDIADLTAGRRRGFGSVRVSVTIGTSTWQTSLFPSKSGTYLLPIKKPIRRTESLTEDTPVEAHLDLIDF